MCNAYSPDSSEKYAIHLPSGDQDGLRSITPVVLVRLRGSPFSAGTVMISPRASKTARAPVGEMWALKIRSPTFSKRGRTVATSAARRMFTFRDLFVLMSYR